MGRKVFRAIKFIFVAWVLLSLVHLVGAGIVRTGLVFLPLFAHPNRSHRRLTKP